MSSSRLAGSPGPPSGHADHLQASDNGTEMSRMQTGICSLELLHVKQEPGTQGLPTSGSDSWTQVLLSHFPSPPSTLILLRSPVLPTQSAPEWLVPARLSSQSNNSTDCPFSD